MRRRRQALIWVGCAAIAVTVPAFGGRDTAAARSLRIVSLVPSITECVYAAGAGERLVGVSRYCDYPDGTRSLAKVGSWDAADAPGIVALKPDLVLGGCCNGPTLRSALRDRGVPMMSLDPQTLEQIVGDIRAIGRKAGTTEVAEKSAQGLERELKEARATASLLPRRPRVLIGSPREGAWLAGPQSFLEDLVRCAGGTIATSRGGWQKHTAAELARLDPEIVILPGKSDAPEAAPEALDSSPFAHWSAVRNRQIYRLPADWLNRPGPRLFRALHPLSEWVRGPAASPAPSGSPLPVR
jgi:iron complex transport system substrate-binding protein